MILLHGSPHGGITTFTRLTHFTANPTVARAYACGVVMGASKTKATRPTIYTCSIDAGRIFDLRNPLHATEYEAVRKHYNLTAEDDDRLPRVEHLRSNSGLPHYGQERTLAKLLHDFDSMWLWEGTHGISLAVFAPADRVVVQSSARADCGHWHPLRDVP